MRAATDKNSYGFAILILAMFVVQGCVRSLHVGSLPYTTTVGGAYALSEYVTSDSNLCLCAREEEYPLQFQPHDSTMIFIASHALPQGTPYEIRTCSDTHRPLAVRLDEKDGMYHFEGRQGRILSFVEQIRLPNDSIASFYGRDGFIHPFYSPGGVELTEDYPRGHTHQHGIFHAWTRSLVHGKMIDFWNQHSQLGTVRLVRSDVVVAGPVFAGLLAELEYLAYVDGDTVVAARELWYLKVYREAAGRNMADVSITQRSVVDSLVLTEYHYGGFGFRANDSWNFEGSEHSPYDSLAHILTSEGHDHTNSNHTRPRWVSMWGEIEGKTAGIAIAAHPTNFRYPQPVRVHPTMPYFTFAPMVLGQFVLTPERIYEANYRIVGFDGGANSSMLDGLAENFAKM